MKEFCHFGNLERFLQVLTRIEYKRIKNVEKMFLFISIQAADVRKNIIG